MGTKLAIKGHTTRGKEVIKILEMLGGVNWSEAVGCTSDRIYYIIDSKAIVFDDDHFDDFIIFTIEEFLEKFPFKVGGKVVDCYGNPVTIKSMSWSEDFKTMVYDFNETEDVLCAEDLEAVNDDNTEPSKMKNVLAELLEHIKTTPKDELEREFEEIAEWANVGPTVEEFRTFCECVNKKPKYPKTFEECLNMLYCKSVLRTIIGHKAELLLNLEKLLICRDAYWKIYGEETGLGKPWEPDWSTGTDRKYVIEVYSNKARTNSQGYSNTILAFPTIEMRDAFYENFRDLIEKCKELL